MFNMISSYQFSFGLYGIWQKNLKDLIFRSNLRLIILFQVKGNYLFKKSLRNYLYSLTQNICICNSFKDCLKVSWFYQREL